MVNLLRLDSQDLFCFVVEIIIAANMESLKVKKYIIRISPVKISFSVFTITKCKSNLKCI